jgi:hypothetical protein
VQHLPSTFLHDKFGCNKLLGDQRAHSEPEERRGHEDALQPLLPQGMPRELGGCQNGVPDVQGSSAPFVIILYTFTV